MFPNFDFIQIQIKLNAPTTSAAKPIPNDMETDDEVLVINEPGDVADDLKEPKGKTTNPFANP